MYHLVSCPLVFVVRSGALLTFPHINHSTSACALLGDFSSLLNTSTWFGHGRFDSALMEESVSQHSQSTAIHFVAKALNFFTLLPVKLS